MIQVDADLLRELAPDLLIVQDLCEVCAIADGELRRLAAVLDPAPRVLTLMGRTMDGVFADIRRVAEALDLTDEGDELVVGLRSRLARLRRGATGRPPRVLCIEWLEPLYLAGHWVPELVAAAGGEDVGAGPGAHSARMTWEAAAALGPECIVVMLCGFGVDRARAELARPRPPAATALLNGAPVWLLDGHAFTSRPGPRLVDGAERLRVAITGGDGEDHVGLARWRLDA